MVLWRKISIVCLEMIFSTSAFAADALSALRDLESKGARVSAIVVDLETGKILAERNSEKRLTPASVTKVVLAAAALEKWGPDFSFVTKVYANGKRKGDSINGDLVVVGDGDPYLTNEKLWFLATDVARAGIKNVSGDLVLNVSAFGDVALDGNRKSGKRYSAHAYDSPLSAAAVNFSVLAAVAAPGEAVGKSAHVSLEPYPLASTKIISSVSTIADNKSGKVSASRTRGQGVDEIRVSGTVSADEFPLRVYRSVSDADEYSGNVIRAFLRESGVKIQGRVKISRDSVSSQASKWIPVAKVEGFPLDWQLRGLFKVSNNFIADMLTVNLGRNDSASGGATLEGGSRRLEEYVRATVSDSRWKLGSLDDLRIESGSGLTPENRISARDIVSVLDKMYRNYRDFPAFYSALPIPGGEGTMRRRFGEKDEKHLRNAVRAKTGTLSEPIDAAGLAGYVRTETGAWAAFAALVNGTKAKPNIGIENIRDAIDADLAETFPKAKM